GQPTDASQQSAVSSRSRVQADQRAASSTPSAVGARGSCTVSSGLQTTDCMLLTTHHSPLTAHAADLPTPHHSPLTTHRKAELRVLCRSLESLRAAVEMSVASIYVDFQDIRQYGQAVSLAHAAGREIYLATPRIQKPAEGPLFKHLMRHGA